MEYYVISAIDDGYGGDCLKKLNQHDVYSQALMNRETNKSNMSIISTAVSPIYKYFRRYRQNYILVLDCDSIDGCMAACHILKTRNINTAIIKSNGENHFWIITDVIGKIDQLIKLMKTIPGVDSSFVDVCDRRKIILLRAIPYDMRIPLFPQEHTLQNPVVIAWYNEFKAHYNSPMMEEVILNIKIQKALNNGQMMSLVSDPQFVF